MDTGGEIEVKEDIADGSKFGEWKLWQRELDNAIEYRKEFDKEVGEYQEIYENDAEGAAFADERYPIFWANVQTLRPLIFSNLPLADIRRRYATKDPVARTSSIMLERATNYFMEVGNASERLEEARDDSLITGMGVVKVRFEADIITDDDGNEDIADKQIKYDFVPYVDYLSSPAKLESLVRWRAYKHKWNKEQLIEQFGESKANDITLESTILENPDDKDTEHETFKRAEVWEIWDKTSGKVKFWSQGYTDGLLSDEDEAYNLEGFFPSPPPINMGKVNTSILPVPPYRMYQSQAEELNIVVDRIINVIEQIKAGGLYNKVLETDAADNLLNNADGEYDAVKFDPNIDINKLIYTKDIVALANVLQVLRVHKVELIEEIREITGISDIVRGTSKASETATAQQLKGNFAISRMQPQQQAMSNFVRGLVRITSELIAENWSGEELAQISNIQVVKNADMERRLLELSLREDLDPEAMQKAAQVMREEQDKAIKTEMAITDATLDQVENLLRSDKLRGYAIDIETETTVKTDSDKLKQDRIEFLNVISGMIGQFVPMVQAGVLPPEALKAIIGFGARPFKVGRELEEAFELIGQAPPAEEQQPEPPSDALIAAQIKSRELDIKERKNEQDHAVDVANVELSRDKIILESHDKENDRDANFNVEELRRIAKQNDVGF